MIASLTCKNQEEKRESRTEEEKNVREEEQALVIKKG